MAGFQNLWVSALHRPPAGLGAVVPRGYPGYRAMWVKVHEGGGRAGGGGVEAKAEAGVRRMEAEKGARMGEAVGFLEAVVLHGC